MTHAWLYQRKTCSYSHFSPMLYYTAWWQRDVFVWTKCPQSLQKLKRLTVELVSSWSLVRCTKHFTTTPLNHELLPVSFTCSCQQSCLAISHVLHKLGPSTSDLCACVQRQTMNHMVDPCPLTKLEGGLRYLHDASDDTVTDGRTWRLQHLQMKWKCSCHYYS